MILYVGKGGVGKTTSAAATAVRAAELGHRTLVVSTDIAHSLADVLDVGLSAEPLRVGERLFAQEINVLEETRREWGQVHKKLTGFLEREGLSELQADELAIVPGMEEVAALVQIARSARSGSYDCIVVDAAPTGETIRLLSMPDTFGWYAGRAKAWQGKLLRVASAFLRGVLPETELLGVGRRLAERVRELRALLINAQHSSYRIVVTPDRTVLKEARRAQTYLSLFQYPIDAVMLNRIIPSVEPRNRFFDALLARQAKVIEEIQAAFAPLPLLRAPYVEREPVGVEALAAFARDVFGERDPVGILHVGGSLRIEQTDGEYVLRIPMPNVELDKLSLRKAGDELYVDLGNVRREVTLPATLAGLEPMTARMRGGDLEIPFSRSRR